MGKYLIFLDLLGCRSQTMVLNLVRAMYTVVVLEYTTAVVVRTKFSLVVLEYYSCLIRLIPQYM